MDGQRADFRHFFTELRRRKVFRTAGLYIVGAWLVLQVADISFPAWGLPETALRYLFIAAALGLPVAIVFGWRYDITSAGIVRTPAEPSGTDDLRLKLIDYAVLGLLALAAFTILWSTIENVFEPVVPTSETMSVEAPANSIAVLPLHTDAAGEEDTFLVAGVAEEILNRLAENKRLKVVGRTSSFAFGGAGFETPRIARTLNVRYLLTVALTRSADGIETVAELLDHQGFVVWRDRNTARGGENHRSLQQAAIMLADGAAGELGATGSAPLADDIDFIAYQDFVIGREHLERRGPDYREKAREAFERALAREPDYPAPMAGLATLYTLETWGLDRASRLAEAERLVRRALELEPDSPDANAAMGLLLETRYEYAEAESYLRRAVALNPSYTNARNWLQISLRGQGRDEEADLVFEEALARDPLHPVLIANYALRLSWKGRYREAVQSLERLRALPETPAILWPNIAALQLEYGHYDALVATTFATLEQSTNPKSYAMGTYALATTFARLGLDAECDAWLQRLADVDVPANRKALIRGHTLWLRGRYEETSGLTNAILAALGDDFSRLPPWVREVVGGAPIFAGDHQRGIAILDELYGGNYQLPRSGGGISAQGIQTYAFGYLQLGDTGKAQAVLGDLERQLEAAFEKGGRAPGLLADLARNYALQGRIPLALETLQMAVDNHYREYHVLAKDPRWDSLRDLPEFNALLEAMRADVDEQATRVQQLLSEVDLDALLAPLLRESAPL